MVVDEVNLKGLRFWQEGFLVSGQKAQKGVGDLLHHTSYSQLAMSTWRAQLLHRISLLLLSY